MWVLYDVQWLVQMVKIQSNKLTIIFRQLPEYNKNNCPNKIECNAALYFWTACIFSDVTFLSCLMSLAWMVCSIRFNSKHCTRRTVAGSSSDPTLAPPAKELHAPHSRCDLTDVIIRAAIITIRSVGIFGELGNPKRLFSKEHNGSLVNQS